MLAKTCQIARIHEDITCSQKRAGFIINAGESPLAVYQAGIVLCKGHGIAVLDVDSDSEFVSIAELSDRMTAEEVNTNATQQTTTQKEATMTTTTTPVQTTTPAVSVIDITPNTHVNLAQLAAQIDTRNADQVSVAPATRLVDIPKASEQVIDAPVSARIKTQEELEEEALSEQIKTLLAQKDAIKKARIAREKAEQEAARAAKAAKAAEAEAARVAKALANDSGYQFSQAGALRASLVLQGGSAALAAVQTLIDAGILTMRSGSLVVKKVDTAPSETTPTTPRAVPSRQTPASPRVEQGERSALKARVRELCARGFRQAEIARQTGLDSRAVWNILHPKQAA